MCTVNYKLSEEDNAQLTIISNCGQVIYTAELTNIEEKIKISVDEFVPGLYFYFIKSDQGKSKTKKLIVM